MAKRLTKKRCRETVIKYRDEFADILCGPRPAGLPPQLSHGIAFVIESGSAAAGRPVAVALTLTGVKPEYLAPKNRPMATTNPPITDEAMAIMDRLCCQLKSVLGIPVRWNWIVGLRDRSDGSDVRFYREIEEKSRERIHASSSPAGYVRSAVEEVQRQATEIGRKNSQN